MKSVKSKKLKNSVGDSSDLFQASNPLSLQVLNNNSALSNYTQSMARPKYDKDIVEIIEIVRILNNLAPLKMPDYNFNIEEINGEHYYKPDGTLAEVYDNGALISQPLYTDAIGHWEAPNMKVLDNGTYDVEFVYDGQTYEPTIFLATSNGDANAYRNASTSERDKWERDSKALDYDREVVNNRILEIFEGSAIDGTGMTQGKVVGNEGEHTVVYNATNAADGLETRTGFNGSARLTSKVKTTDADGRILDIFKYNDEADNNTTLAKYSSIGGYAVELLYIDENSNARFKALPGDEVAIVYDNTLEENILYAIRHFEEDIPGEDKTRTTINVYTSNAIQTYQLEDNEITFIDEVAHYFNDVPVSVYVNNDELYGDFERVKGLIDAYDKTQSDTANDFELFTNCMLVVNGDLFVPFIGTVIVISGKFFEISAADIYKYY